MKHALVLLLLLCSGKLFAEWQEFSKAGVRALFPSTPIVLENSKEITIGALYKDCGFKVHIPAELTILESKETKEQFLESLLRRNREEFGQYLSEVSEQTTSSPPWIQVRVSEDYSGWPFTYRYIYANGRLYVGELICHEGDYPSKDVESQFFNGIRVGFDNKSLNPGVHSVAAG